ncbi:MAG: hypothetical protein AAGD32_10965 [Planctomycetota bacterium]
MTRFNVYGTRIGDVHRNVRGGVTGLPAWGRFIVTLAALPGLALLAFAIVIGLLALLVLLLTAGVAFWLVMKVNGLFAGGGETRDTRRPHSKRVDVTVLDSE